MRSIKKKGYLLIEAILGAAIVSSAILFKTQVEVKSKQIDDVREFAAKLAVVPYAIDKRTLLDGHTLSLSSTNFTGAQQTVQNFLEKALIGSASAACAGGWTPIDLANGAMNLIPCNLFNYGKMPFSMDMNGAYALTPDGTVRSFYVDVYHPNNTLFQDYSHVYAQLVGYARVLDGPQITGSHRYYLVNKNTSAELTPSECNAVMSACAFRAEYTTNYVGMGEDPYLRVNGGNFMVGDIAFRGVASAPLECRNIDSAGVQTMVNCGLDYDEVNQNLSINSNELNSQEIKLANTSLLNSSGNVMSVSCTAFNGTTSVTVPCGMTLLKHPANTNKVLARLAQHEITFSESLYAKNGSIKTIEMNAATGNIKTEGLLESYGGGKFQASNTSLGLLQRLTLNESQTLFEGELPKYESTDQFGQVKTPTSAAARNTYVQNAKDLVTKGYLHSFNQIISVDKPTSGSVNDRYICPNGNPAELVAMPLESTLLMSESQIDNVCPYQAGDALPTITPTLTLEMPTSDSIQGQVTIDYSVGCRWEGDYAHAWYLESTDSEYQPFFYLISPKDSSGNVTNIEVGMNFLVIQYCDNGGLNPI